MAFVKIKDVLSSNLYQDTTSEAFVSYLVLSLQKKLEELLPELYLEKKYFKVYSYSKNILTIHVVASVVSTYLRSYEVLLKEYTRKEFSNLNIIRIRYVTRASIELL